MAVVDKLYGQVGSDPGYADVGLDFRASAVDLSYHGPLPPKLDAVVSDAKLQGVAVRQIDVAHGAAELREDTIKLGNALSAGGIAWDGISATADYSALQISGPQVSNDTALQARAIAIAKTSGLGVSIEFGADEHGTFASRQADHNPYHGGARIYNDYHNGTLGVCTSGFGMYVSSTQYYLLTAAHCADFANDADFETGAGVSLGKNKWTQTLYNDNELDATLIPLGTGIQSANSVYSSGWNTNVPTSLSGYEPFAFGEIACNSGSVTGVRCYIQRTNGSDVHAVNFCGNVNPCPILVMHVEPSGTGGAVIFAKGDSGGPTYRVTTSGTRYGVATISAGDASATCDSNMDTTGNPPCFSTGWLTPLNRVQDVLNPHGIYGVP